mgnify:CR=1 FL=1
MTLNCLQFVGNQKQEIDSLSEEIEMLRNQLLQADGNENKESILLEEIAMKEQELGMYDSIRNKLATPLRL